MVKPIIFISEHQEYVMRSVDCPNCDVCGDYINGSYCSDCGQKIDWGNEE